MTTTFRAGLVALLGLGLLSPAALASKAPAPTYHGQMTVEDKAGVFTADGIRKAEGLFEGVAFKAKTHFTVVTVGSAPADKKAELDTTKGDASKAGKFFGGWAKELAKQHGEKGVFVLIYSEGDKFFVKAVADEQSDVFRSFTDKDATAVEQKLVAAFRDAKTKSGDDAKRVRDGGLKDAAQVVVEELKDTTVPAGHTTNADGSEKKKSEGWPIWLWVVVVLGALLVIWIIIALIRAMTGNVYGGGYGGGGYGGGYGGGGGPGFFGMFMGGMLGSMAGMWMYNSMMGTHYSHDPGAAAGDTGAADGGTGADADAGAGNFDNGAEGDGGGDWGNDGGGNNDAGGGGGDWGNDGGGGGDWGGGGDAGGGGDFGGGGGDW